jgi:isoleucyl-tRNA synthetase
VIDTSQQAELRPRQPFDGRRLPVVASPDVAASAGASGKLELSFGGQIVHARLVAVTSHFPTTQDSGDSFVIADEASRLLAPYTPFLAEELHQHLVRPVAPGEPGSVHWCDYPESDRTRIDEALERSMELVLRVVNMARAARSASSLRVRQPLRRLAVAGLGEREVRDLATLADLVKDELNVKELVTLQDRGELLSVTVKPNFAVLGKKVGGAMKEVAARLTAASPEEIRAGIAGEGYEVEAAGQRHRVTAEDVIVLEASRAPWVAVATR